MRKRIAAAAIGLAMIAGPAAAQAALDVGINPPEPYENRYLELRREYVKEFGVRSAGRNIVLDGYREGDGDVRQATRGEVLRSIARMDSALHPETAAPVESTTTAAYAGVSSSTVMCESGGDYSANTGNGYYGGYQFDSSTWDAYGDPSYAEASDAPPAVQDAAAASVPYDAWPSC